MNILGYDAWKLQGPTEIRELGKHEGETCNRINEPDEGAPLEHQPQPCNGIMFPDAGRVSCDKCFNLA